MFDTILEEDKHINTCNLFYGSISSYFTDKDIRSVARISSPW